ncbi:hypothetical protein GCM10011394_05990 [Luteimonas terricola]|uniref:Uncharacterized protein n=1 Tax=Luteimonas terricola TaxID=645597 RepID=A0ABQ2EAW2_9GAMM|nr:hypothetical protein GCM10011394_05990 [Luteimonas terricola]
MCGRATRSGHCALVGSTIPPEQEQRLAEWPSGRLLRQRLDAFEIFPQDIACALGIEPGLAPNRYAGSKREATVRANCSKSTRRSVAMANTMCQSMVS